HKSPTCCRTSQEQPARSCSSSPAEGEGSALLFVLSAAPACSGPSAPFHSLRSTPANRLRLFLACGGNARAPHSSFPATKIPASSPTSTPPFSLTYSRYNVRRPSASPTRSVIFLQASPTPRVRQ